jgi:hypothetical protein
MMTMMMRRTTMMTLVVVKRAVRFLVCFVLKTRHRQMVPVMTAVSWMVLVLGVVLVMLHLPWTALHLCSLLNSTHFLLPPRPLFRNQTRAE